MNVRQQIETLEPRRYEAYPDLISRDGAPYTIGVGHVSFDVVKGERWTDEQIDRQLDADLAHASDECRRQFAWFEQLDEVRQAVLIHLVFRIGLRNFLGFALTLWALSNHQYKTAANLLGHSLWAAQNPRLANALIKQLSSGEWSTTL